MRRGAGASALGAAGVLRLRLAARQGGAGGGLLRSAAAGFALPPAAQPADAALGALPLPCAAGSPSEHRRASTPATSRSSGRCRSRLGRRAAVAAASALEVRAHALRLIRLERAGVRLRLRYADFLQHIQNGFALDFELSC